MSWEELLLIGEGLPPRLHSVLDYPDDCFGLIPIKKIPAMPISSLSVSLQCCQVRHATFRQAIALSDQIRFDQRSADVVS
jgi:hypothetical protein